MSRPETIQNSAPDDPVLERARLEAAVLEREAERLRAEPEPGPDGAAPAIALLLALADLRDARLGDSEGALAALEEARRAQPDSPAVLAAVRRLAVKLWRWPLAADVLAVERRQVAGDERVARTLELAEILDERLGRGDEALTLLCEVLDGDPAEPRALARAIPLWTARAAWSDLLGALESAAEEVLAAGDADPGDAAQGRGADPSRAAALLCEAADVARTRLGSFERAADLLQRAMELAPGEGVAARALFEVAAILRDGPRLALALEREAALASSPEVSAAALVALGGVREDLLGDAAGAEAAYRAALERVPTDRIALGALVRLAEAKGDHALHAELLERSLLLATDVKEAIALSLALGTLYEEALGSPDRAANHFRRVLAVTADEAPAFRALGRLLAATGDWRGLAELYEREARETPDPLHRTHCLFKIAELQEERLGDDAAAIAGYRRVLEGAPTYLPALRALGRLFQRNGDWASLVDLYLGEADATRDPSHAASLLARVAELREEKLGDLEGAVTIWRRVLAMSAEPANAVESSDPSLPALRALGRLHHRRGSWEDLVEVNLREAASTRDPRVVAALLQKTGEIYEERLGVAEDALRCYREALEHVPNYLPAMRSLGRLAAASGRWEDVVRTEELEAEGTADPRRAASMLASAAEHYERKLGDDARAIGACERVLSRVPTYLPALAALARLYRKAGRWEDLARTLETTIPAVDRDPAAAAALHARIAAIEARHLRHDVEAAARLAKARALAPRDPSVRRQQDELLLRTGDDTELASIWATAAEEEAPGPWKSALFVRLGALARRLGDGGPGGGTGSAAGFFRAAIAGGPKPEAGAGAGDGDVRASALRAAAAALDALGRSVGDDAMRIEALSTLTLAASTPRERRALLVEHARLHERAGDAAGAEACWTAAARIAPDVEAWEAAGAALLHLGRPADAAAALDRAADAATVPVERVRFAVAAAHAWASAGKWREAEASLEPHGTSGAIPVLLALERVLEGWHAIGGETTPVLLKLAEVQKRLAAALRDPGHRTAVMLRVAATLAGPLERPGEAAEMLEAIAAAEPSGSRLHHDAAARLVDLYGDLRDPLRQGSALERLAEGASGAERAAHLVRAGEVLRAVDVDRAILCWERAVSTDLVAAAPALQGLIAVYGERQAWQPLLATWNRVIQTTRDAKVAADAFYRKGVVLEDRLGLAEKAEDHYQRALTADPDCVPALERMVEIDHRAGRLDAARKRLETLIATAPDDAEVTQQRRIRLARLDRDAGDDARALERLHAVMARFPDRTDVNEQILEILAARPDGPAYIAALRNAALSASEPRRSELRMRLAEALETRASDEAGAIAEYRGILRGDPEHVAARAALASILSRKRESRPDAIAAHAALLKIAPARAESLRWLASAYEEMKHHDKVLCLVGVLRHLGEASEEQGLFYDDQIPKAPRPGRPGVRAVTPEDRRALLLHPDARSNTADLLTRVGGYVWAGVTPDAARIRGKGRERVERLGAGSRNPLRVRFDAIRALFGMNSPADLVLIPPEGQGESDALNDGNGPVSIVPGDPPVVVAGPGLATMPAAAQDFHLARAVFRLACGWGPEGRTASEVRGDLWLVAAALDLTEAPKNADPKRLRSVARAIPRKLRKELAEPLGIFVNRPNIFDVELFVRGAERSADRAGVLAAVEIGPSLERLGLPAGPAPESLPPAAREALAFAVGDDLFNLRRKTGLTIFPT